MKNYKLNFKGLYGYRQSLLSRSPQPRDNRETSERRPSEERTLWAPVPQRFGRYAAILIMLLTLGVGQMWAGDPYMSGFGIQFRDDGGTWFKTGSKDNCSSGVQECDFGSKTNLKIVYIYANGNKNGGNLCGDNYFKYEIYGTTGTANWGGTNRGSCNWSGDVPTYKWGTENSSTAWIDLVKDRKPGDYRMEFYMSFNGNSSSSGCSGWYDCKYSGNNWKFTWSIPDPTITITGASSLVVGTSTNIKATITNYPVGATVTKVRVTGNIASAKETTGSASYLTVSSVVPNASGANGITVTVTVTYGTAGTVDYTYNYNVSPPAVSGFSVTEANHLSGDGTSSGTAYVLPYNGTLSLSLTGSKAATDANSAAQYYNTSSNNAWSTTSTKSIGSVTSTTATSTTVKMRYKNSTTSTLVGAESSAQIWYKSEASYNVTAAKTPSAGGSVTPTSATKMGTTTGGNITASHSTGYHFDSWAITSGSGYFGESGTATTSTTANTKFRPTATSTVTATFVPNEYSITLHDNNGGSNNGSATATFDSNTLTSISAPTKTGYNLEGYYTSSNCTTKVATTAGTLQANISVSGTRWTHSTSGAWVVDAGKTFYANWTAKNYTVTLDKNGGDSDGSITTTYDSSTGSSFSPASRAGYSCTGYYDDPDDGEGNLIINADGTIPSSTVSGWLSSGTWVKDGADITLYAHWEEDLTYYDVTFGVGTSYTSFGSISATNNSTSSAISSGDDLVSGTSVTFTASPNTGYEVAGFYSDASCTSSLQSGNTTTYTIASLSADVTVYVKFQPITYTITYNLNGGTGASNSTYTIESSLITLPTAPTVNKTGYTFNGWYDNSSFTGSAKTSIAAGSTGDKAYWAKWIANPYTITLNNHGATTAGTTSISVTYDATTNLTGTPAITVPQKDGYTFGGYYTGESGAGTQIIAANGNVNASAGGGSTYTSATKQWKYAGDITLHAKWTARPYKIVGILKPTNWTNIYAYAYKDNGGNAATKYNATWPGIRLDNNLDGTGLTPSDEDACNLYYYKFYTDGLAGDAEGNGTQVGGAASAWDKVIFNNGSGTQTNAFTINASNNTTRYYRASDASGATGTSSAFTSDWWLRGNFNGSDKWSSWNYPITIDCSTNTGYIVMESLSSSNTQYLRIYQASTDKWYRITSSSSDAALSIGTNYTLQNQGTGADYFTPVSTTDYRFSLNVANPSAPVLTVSPATDNDYSATISIHSFGHGSTTPAAGAITLHQYTPTTITATPEAGYRFKQWNTTGSVTCSNSTSATATFTASAAGGTIEAEFTQDGIIYFDNTMSQWKGDIYVYFFSNNAWYDNVSDGKGPGMVPTVNSRGYGKMTRISSSNVYYFNYHEASITPTQYIGFTKGDHHTSNGVYQTSAAYLTDFNSCFPMYLASQNWTTTNATGYHNAGYWKRYNVTESGFDIRGLNSTWTADLHPFTSTTPNSNTFKTTVTLNNATHEFKIYRCYGAELGNNGKMTPVNHSGWEMTPGTNNCRIEAPSGGDYEFTLNLGSDHIYLSVEFPLLQDDYRLLYTGRITTDGSDSHKHPSQSIRHLTGNNKEQKDTISFWIDKDHQGTIQLQQCTNPAANGGKGSWSNITSVSYSGVTKTGIYNFVITQTTNGSGARTVTATPLSENFKYEDDLYIRTDASDGGWEAYKYVEDNKLEYSEWARDHSGYDYYHCYFAGTGCNVHFTIANKYSSSLTDTLTTDAIVTSGNLRYQCNVRFMYTSSSNKIGRAYLNGSSETGDNEFLVLQGASSGAQIKKKDGTALDGNKTKLDDNGNWIYSIDIKADETARVKLISNYRFDEVDHNQWFIGTSAAWSNASTEQILGGNTPSKSHLIRVIYDFKTNHLISAWLADGEEVDEVKAINTSVMIVREHQLDAEQITFSGGKLTEVGTVYCVMKFNKWTLNNKAKAEPHSALAPLLSPYERGLYWISFPFDVKLNDVFGFGQYGQHWIIEYYDGKTRAQKGFWSESPVNWKYVMPSEKDDYILKANVGYVLALDLDEMTESSHVWDYVEDVHLYFPSKDPVHNILQKNVSVDIDQDGYQCTINRTTEGLGPEYDRRIRDSYWHCIGVPSFANNSHTLKHDGWAEEAEPYYPDLDLDDPEDDWTAASLPFYYAWNPETNALAPYSDGGSLTFKAMNSYLVQYSQATMSWTNVSTPSASIVARKKAKAEDIHFTEFKLELMKGEESVDYTFIRLTDNEEVTSGFEFGHDLCKEFNNGKANIYTFIEDVQVAGNSLPLESEKTTIVPVGVKATAAGEYTFAMPEGTNGTGVTLVDNETGDRTNLAMSDYSVTLNAGTIDGRFVLEISPVAQTPTGIEEVTGDGLQVTGARKVMVDGVLYIVKEGKVFDARGTRCK